MKTGYVYIVALNGRGLGRFARVLRLCVSLRHPQERVDRLANGAWRTRRPRLVGFEFVEDMIGARAQVRAALKRFRLGGRGRSFWCVKSLARAELHAAGERQSALRSGRFHPVTGLLVDREIELGGPIAQLTAHIAEVVADGTHGDLGKLDLFLHPYTVGTIASVFHHTQRHTRIPDDYFPEILREIAWRSWKCRLKPEYFVAVARRTREDQKYLELARYRFETGLKAKARPQIPEAQLAAFLRQPNQHLRETVTSYAEALEHSPRLRVRRVAFRAGRLALAIGGALGCEAVLAGGTSENWIFALLLLFLTGVTVLAFNLYETPDLSKGIGFLTAREAAQELARLRQRGSDAPKPVPAPREQILRMA